MQIFYERFHHSAIFLILLFSFSSICCISSCNVPLQGKFSIAGQSTHFSSIVGDICLSNFCHELLYLKLYSRKIGPQFWKSPISAVVYFLRMNDSCRSCYSGDRSWTQDVRKIKSHLKKSDQRQIIYRLFVIVRKSPAYINIKTYVTLVQ